MARITAQLSTPDKTNLPALTRRETSAAKGFSLMTILLPPPYELVTACNTCPISPSTGEPVCTCTKERGTAMTHEEFIGFLDHIELSVDLGQPPAVDEETAPALPQRVGLRSLRTENERLRTELAAARGLLEAAHAALTVPRPANFSDLGAHTRLREIRLVTVHASIGICLGDPDRYDRMADYLRREVTDHPASYTVRQDGGA